MGNILVLYDSATGHTQKMAEEIARGAAMLGTMNVRLLHIDRASRDDLVWCDGIALGAPTNMGLLSWKMKKFWDVEAKDLWSKIDGKIGCAFSSSGGWGGGTEITCMSLLTVLINFGFLVFGVPDYVGEKHTLHYGAIVAGEPREPHEINACVRLGERLAHWVESCTGSPAIIK
ncbi:MAG: flavodoxin family protein [Calditrichales bacterium]|nr:MAG: flavodoxin family protein [Calditrichales bacterium]